MSTTITISIPTDEQGYLGRECPECHRYFKVMLGTGLTDPTPCFCAYCGHQAAADEFLTQDQLEFAKSAALRYAHGELFKMLKRYEGPIGRQDRFIKMSLKVTPGSSPAAFRYRERDLESQLTCAGCTLQYTIFGVFAYCPDCGQHNSEQILNNNLNVVEKMLAVSELQEPELKQHIIEDALENSVSAFDGFGREFMRILRSRRGLSDGSDSFQNIARARERLVNEYAVDVAMTLSAEEWGSCTRSFQKRHVLAHSMGVVDAAYVSATDDSSAVVGHKIKIGKSEVAQLVATLRKLARSMVEQLDQPSSLRSKD